MKIKDLPYQDRPREKLMVFGAGFLSDSELLAIILGTGTRKNSAVEIAQNILRQTKLDEMADKGLAELCRIKGIGKVKACKILACSELARRMKNCRPMLKRIKSSEDVAIYLIGRLSGLKQENFVILLLDSRNNLLKEETVFVGSLNETLIHPREIFNRAIKECAAGIIIVHNHPSGDPTPSNEDIKMTKDLFKIGKLVGIDVLDHIVIGESNFVSFKDAGLI